GFPAASEGLPFPVRSWAFTILEPVLRPPSGRPGFAEVLHAAPQRLDGEPDHGITREDQQHRAVLGLDRQQFEDPVPCAHVDPPGPDAEDAIEAAAAMAPFEMPSRRRLVFLEWRVFGWSAFWRRGFLVRRHAGMCVEIHGVRRPPPEAVQQ